MAKKKKAKTTTAAKAKKEAVAATVTKETKAVAPAVAENPVQKADTREAVKTSSTPKSKPKTAEIVKAVETAKVATDAKPEEAVKASKSAIAPKAEKAVKSARKTKTDAAPSEVIKVQFGFDEYDIDAIKKAVHVDFKNKHKGCTFKNVEIYVKPEDKAAYYVVNSKFSEKIEL